MHRLITVSLLTAVTTFHSAAHTQDYDTQEYRNQTGLDLIKAGDAYRLGFTGQGVTIGVVDSGIVAWHPEFAGQIVGGYDFMLSQAVSQSSGIDTDGHGSHVSGIMAARRDGVGMHGVAFNAKIFSTRYGADDNDDDDDDDNGIDDFDIGSGITFLEKARAIDPIFGSAWNYMARQGLTVINNSLGLNSCALGASGTATEPCNVKDFDLSTDAGYTGNFKVDELFGETILAMHRLKDAGTLMVFATGNEAQPHPDILAGMPVFFPELAPNWLAVTAVNVDIDFNNPVVATYANKCGDAKAWCLAAPGSRSTPDANDSSTWQGIWSVNKTGLYIPLPGTSMAAPHVTGAAALVKEAFPFFNAYQLQQTLLTTATDLTPLDGKRYDDTFGWGLLNVGKAVLGPSAFVSVFDVDTKGYSATFSNNIGDLSGEGLGAGSIIKRGAGTLTLAGTNNYTGTTTVEGGTLIVAGTNNTGDTIVNEGNLTVDRSGQLNSTTNTVNGGKMVVNGNLATTSTTTVKLNGILGGRGNVGILVNEGTVAPGNSVGTLTVKGNYTQTATSVLEIEVDGNNGFDQLVVDGNAALDGTLALRGGPFRQGVNYNFLSVAGGGGLTGNFAQIDTSLLFLSPSLSVSGTGISLSVARNAQAFAAYTHTANQRNVAAALDPFSANPPTGLSSVYDDVLNATARTLPGLMDALSGEIHASVAPSLFSQSQLWTASATRRLNQVLTRPDIDQRRPLWVTVQRQWSDLNGVNGSANTRSYANGLFLGADTALRNGWHAGAALGAHDTRIDVGERRSRADAHSYTAALYGTKHWPTSENSALNWRASTAYTYHDLNTRRQLDVGGSQTLKADYHAHQVQAFTELGYAFAANQNLVLEPYARLGWTQLQTSSMRENGGQAALQSGATTDRQGTLNLGLRAYSELALTPATTARINGELSWQHTHGDTTATRHMAFANATDVGFSVKGAPVARNALQLALNGEVDVNKSTQIGLNYSGQFGGGNTQNTASLYLNLRY